MGRARLVKKGSQVIIEVSFFFNEGLKSQRGSGIEWITWLAFMGFGWTIQDGRYGLGQYGFLVLSNCSSFISKNQDIQVQLNKQSMVIQLNF